MRAACGLLLASVLMATPAWAQSETGVSVALVGDISRSDGAGDLFGSGSSDGEALTFSLRVDRSLGSKWGVELEYVYGGKIENEISGPSCPACLVPLSLAGSSLVPTAVTSILASTVLPSYTYKARRSTVSPGLWYRQSIGGRTSLVYSAGIALLITKTEQTFRILGLPNQSLIAPATSKFTHYTAAPIVGIDARVSLTDHASLVPGFRLIIADGGVIMHPAIGLRWQF